LTLGVTPRRFANSFWRLPASLRVLPQIKQRLISILMGGG
jgi:hypothetical protein